MIAVALSAEEEPQHCILGDWKGSQEPVATACLVRRTTEANRDSGCSQALNEMGNGIECRRDTWEVGVVKHRPDID